MAEARALYRDLKRVESQLNRAQTADDLRYIAAQEGSRVGYKTLALLLTGRTTPEKLRPSEVPYEQALATYDVRAPADVAALVNAPDFPPTTLGPMSIRWMASGSWSARRLRCSVTRWV